MMKTRLFNRGPLAAIAITVLAATGLAACSPDPYPTPMAEEPPPPPPVELAGGDYPPPPPPPPPPVESYSSSAPVVIAMAPIPNPPETPRRAPRPRVSGSYSTPPRYVAPTAPAPRAAPAAPRAAAPARPSATASTTRAPAASAPSTVARGPTPVTPPAQVAPGAKPALPATQAPATPKVAAAPNAAPKAAAPTGARAERLDMLRSALADIVSGSAKLTVPGTFAAGVPADVTLNIPAEFADQVKTEADKNGLTDAARSVNLTALLSGDGFVVTPDETQSQPLIAGKPTEFKWSVTAQPNARASTLKADVGADLLGGGMETLNLGSVTAGDTLFGFKVDKRLVGGGLLVALFVLVIAWLTRGRGGPTRSASARRAARRQVRSDRPFDLDREPA